MYQMVASYKRKTSNKIPGSDEYELLVFFVSGSTKFGNRKARKILKYASTGWVAEVAFWVSGVYGAAKYMSEYSGLAGKEIILIQH